MPSTADVIEIAKISVSLVVKAIENNQENDLQLPKKISTEVYLLQWAYSNNYTGIDIDAFTDYVYGMCGGYAYEAEGLIGTGGIVINPASGGAFAPLALGKYASTGATSITFSEAIKHNNITNNNTNSTINSHNKTFNLQVFLNEDCKDAMNINEFVESIKFQLADLEHMGQVGYVEGISNIIIKNLKGLDVTKRPVHCTDQKRETIYIKDEGIWIKEDEGNKNVRKMIKRVAFRNSKCIRLFKEKHPDCNQADSRYSDTYNKIVLEAMGGGSKCNDHDSENKIIKKVSKVVTIDRSTFS